ncbi:MAG: SH3 domain-containing protein [Chlamydiales bacterium]
MTKLLIATMVTCCLTIVQGELRANEETVTLQSAAFEPFTGSVVGSKVRLRTQPNLEGHVICETSSNEMFGVLGEENGYYAISPPRGTKGYVFRTFVLDNTIEGERVNVRLYPDIEAPVIARLNTGDKVSSSVSDANNKWLEIDLPKTAYFYIAKEFIDKKGPIELIAQLESRHHEAMHLLSATFLFAQNEIQKTLPHIDLDAVNNKFTHITTTYADLPDICASAHDANRLIQELYVQKKIAFLESRTNNSTSIVEFSQEQLDKLAALGIKVNPVQEESAIAEVGLAASETMGLSSTLSDQEMTDKMLLWEPMEQALFHLWAAANNEDSIEDFYRHENLHAIYISGMLEPYNRPVKNVPGDFVLRHNNHPVAFLYSTRVNLQKMVGKNVTIRVAPRPNNHFAYPAYFVLSVE